MDWVAKGYTIEEARRGVEAGAKPSGRNVFSSKASQIEADQRRKIKEVNDEAIQAVKGEDEVQVKGNETEVQAQQKVDREKEGKEADEKSLGVTDTAPSGSRTEDPSDEHDIEHEQVDNILKTNSGNQRYRTITCRYDMKSR